MADLGRYWARCALQPTAPAPGPPPPWGGSEGLVQVQVDAVEAHVAGADYAHNGVQVGTVVVAQTASLVDQAGDLQDVLIEDTYGVGVGKHQTGGILAQNSLQRLQIHAAVGCGGDVYDGVATHGSGGGVSAVGGVGDDDLAALAVAPGFMVLLDQQHAGELAVSAGGRLEGHVVHAGDLTQQLPSGVQHLLTAFHGVLGSQGMHAGKAGQSGHFLVNAGIVLHGAGAQRVEAGVDAVNTLVQLSVVAAEVGLTDLGQLGCFGTNQGSGQCHFLHVALGQVLHTAAGNALFKNQLHAHSTSFTMETALSSCSLEIFSVAHHRIPSSTAKPPRMSAFSRADRTSSVLGMTVTNSWK